MVFSSKWSKLFTDVNILPVTLVLYLKSSEVFERSVWKVR